MFKYYPDIHLDAKGEEDFALGRKTLDDLADDANPFDAASNTVSKVVIEMQAMMQIVKHGNEMSQQMEIGILNGLFSGDTMEITNVIPYVYERGKTTMITKENEEKMNKNVQRIREALENSGLERNHVGYYIIAPAGQYFAQRIMSKLEELAKSNMSVLVVYDPRRTRFGKLYLRAFSFTKNYYDFILEQFVYENENRAAAVAVRRDHAKRMLRSLRVYESGILSEIPIALHASTDQKLLMQNYCPNPTLPIISNTSKEKLVYCEKTLNHISTNLKALSVPISYMRLGIEAKELLTMEETIELAKALESACDSIILNSAVIKEI